MQRKKRIVADQRFDLLQYNSMLNLIDAEFNAYNQSFFSPENRILSGWEVEAVGGLEVKVGQLVDSFLFTSEREGYEGINFRPAGEEALTLELDDNATNYVEIEIYESTCSPDTVAIWDSTANSGRGEEFSQTVDTILDQAARLVSSTISFTGDENKIPLAIVTTSAGAITNIEDARKILFELEEPYDLSSGDRGIDSIKAAYDALATAILEMKGSDNWFDPPASSLKEVKDLINITFTGSLASFDGAQVSWDRPIQIDIAGRQHSYTVDPTTIAIADGEVIYVPIPSGESVDPLIPSTDVLSAVGAAGMQPMFYRKGDVVYGYAGLPDILKGDSGSIGYSAKRSGFPRRDDSQISFNDATREFLIEPESTEFKYSVEGSLYVKTSQESLTIPDVSGVHYIYYDKSTLSTTMSRSESLFDEYCSIAAVLWDSASQEHIMLNDIRSGVDMDVSTKIYLDSTQGFTYASGMGLSYNESGLGNNDADVQIAIEDGVAFSKDLKISINNSLNPNVNFEQVLSPIAEIPVYYRDGSDWKRNSATLFPVATTGSGRIAFDDSGVLTEAVNTGYVAYWVYATTSIVEPIISVVGQREDPSLEAAQTNNVPSDLDISGMPVEEMKLLYRVIFQTADSFGSSVKGDIADVLDIRTGGFSLGVASGGGEGGALPKVFLDITNVPPELSPDTQYICDFSDSTITESTIPIRWSGEDSFFIAETPTESGDQEGQKYVAVKDVQGLITETGVDTSVLSKIYEREDTVQGGYHYYQQVAEVQSGTGYDLKTPIRSWYSATSLINNPEEASTATFIDQGYFPDETIDASQSAVLPMFWPTLSNGARDFQLSIGYGTTGVQEKAYGKSNILSESKRYNVIGTSGDNKIYGSSEDSDNIILNTGGVSGVFQFAGRGSISNHDNSRIAVFGNGVGLSGSNDLEDYLLVSTTMDVEDGEFVDGSHTVYWNGTHCVAYEREAGHYKFFENTISEPQVGNSVNAAFDLGKSSGGDIIPTPTSYFNGTNNESFKFDGFGYADTSNTPATITRGGVWPIFKRASDDGLYARSTVDDIYYFIDPVTGGSSTPSSKVFWQDSQSIHPMTESMKLNSEDDYKIFVKRPEAGDTESAIVIFNRDEQAWQYIPVWDWRLLFNGEGLPRFALTDEIINLTESGDNISPEQFNIIQLSGTSDLLNGDWWPYFRGTMAEDSFTGEIVVSPNPLYNMYIKVSDDSTYGVLAFNTDSGKWETRTTDEFVNLGNAVRFTPNTAYLPVNYKASDFTIDAYNTTWTPYGLGKIATGLFDADPLYRKYKKTPNYDFRVTLSNMTNSLFDGEYKLVVDPNGMMTKNAAESAITYEGVFNGSRTFEIANVNVSSNPDTVVDPLYWNSAKNCLMGRTTSPYIYVIIALDMTDTVCQDIANWMNDPNRSDGDLRENDRFPVLDDVQLGSNDVDLIYSYDFPLVYNNQSGYMYENVGRISAMEFKPAYTDGDSVSESLTYNTALMFDDQLGWRAINVGANSLTDLAPGEDSSLYIESSEVLNPNSSLEAGVNVPENYVRPMSGLGTLVDTNTVGRAFGSFVFSLAVDVQSPEITIAHTSGGMTSDVINNKLYYWRLVDAAGDVWTFFGLTRVDSNVNGIQTIKWQSSNDGLGSGQNFYSVRKNGVADSFLNFTTGPVATLDLMFASPTELSFSSNQLTLNTSTLALSSTTDTYGMHYCEDGLGGWNLCVRNENDEWIFSKVSVDPTTLQDGDVVDSVEEYGFGSVSGNDTKLPRLDGPDVILSGMNDPAHDGLYQFSGYNVRDDNSNSLAYTGDGMGLWQRFAGYNSSGDKMWHVIAYNTTLRKWGLRLMFGEDPSKNILPDYSRSLSTLLQDNIGYDLGQGYASFAFSPDNYIAYQQKYENGEYQFDENGNPIMEIDRAWIKGPRDGTDVTYVMNFGFYDSTHELPSSVTEYNELGIYSSNIGAVFKDSLRVLNGESVSNNSPSMPTSSNGYYSYTNDTYGIFWDQDQDTWVEAGKMFNLIVSGTSYDGTYRPEGYGMVSGGVLVTSTEYYVWRLSNDRCFVWNDDASTWSISGAEGIGDSASNLQSITATDLVLYGVVKTPLGGNSSLDESGTPEDDINWAIINNLSPVSEFVNGANAPSTTANAGFFRFNAGSQVISDVSISDPTNTLNSPDLTDYDSLIGVSAQYSTNFGTSGSMTTWNETISYGSYGSGDVWSLEYKQEGLDSLGDPLDVVAKNVHTGIYDTSEQYDSEAIPEKDGVVSYEFDTYDLVLPQGVSGTEFSVNIELIALNPLNAATVKTQGGQLMKDDIGEEEEKSVVGGAKMNLSFGGSKYFLWNSESINPVLTSDNYPTTPLVKNASYIADFTGQVGPDIPDWNFQPSNTSGMQMYSGVYEYSGFKGQTQSTTDDGQYYKPVNSNGNPNIDAIYVGKDVWSNFYEIVYDGEAFGYFARCGLRQNSSSPTNVCRPRDMWNMSVYISRTDPQKCLLYYQSNSGSDNGDFDQGSGLYVVTFPIDVDQAGIWESYDWSGMVTTYPTTATFIGDYKSFDTQARIPNNNTMPFGLSTNDVLDFQTHIWFLPNSASSSSWWIFEGPRDLVWTDYEDPIDVGMNKLGYTENLQYVNSISTKLFDGGSVRVPSGVEQIPIEFFLPYGQEGETFSIGVNILSLNRRNPVKLVSEFDQHIFVKGVDKGVEYPLDTTQNATVVFDNGKFSFSSDASNLGAQGWTFDIGYPSRYSGGNSYGNVEVVKQGALANFKVYMFWDKDSSNNESGYDKFYIFDYDGSTDSYSKKMPLPIEGLRPSANVTRRFYVQSRAAFILGTDDLAPTEYLCDLSWNAVQGDMTMTLRWRDSYTSIEEIPAGQSGFIFFDFTINLENGSSDLIDVPNPV